MSRGIQSAIANASLALLVVLIGFDLCAYIATRELSRRVEAGLPVLRQPFTGPLRPPEGLGLGKRVAAGSNRRCWVLRYSSMECRFCREDDRGEWGRLASMLTGRGCAVYVVPPEIAGSYLRATLVPRQAEQVIFVGVQWARQFRLALTPTTIVVGAGGQVAWYHLGKMAKQDTRAALAAMAAARRSRLW